MGVVYMHCELIVAEVRAYFGNFAVQFDQGVFEWNISGDLMQQFKNAQYQKFFYSPRFKAIGCEWYVRIYPNGWTTKGTAELDIVCHSIECKEVNVSYYVDSSSLAYSQINCDGRSIKKKNDDIPFDPPFHHKDIQNQSELIFRVKLWHKATMDTMEERFVSNVLSEKKTLPKEWIECAMTPANEIWRFLALLGLEEHAPAFLENDLHTMQDLKTVPIDDLKGMGIPHMRCKQILIEMCVYFGIKPNLMQLSNEESKENDASDGANSRKNPFVACVGISKYNKPLADLNTAKDIKTYKGVFEGIYNYKVDANDPSKPMNAKQLKRFLRRASIKIVDHND
eukprot:141988_1